MALLPDFPIVLGGGDQTPPLHFFTQLQHKPTHVDSEVPASSMGLSTRLLCQAVLLFSAWSYFPSEVVMQ